MADLTGGLVGTTVNAAVHNDAGADAGTDGNGDLIVYALSCTQGQLCQSHAPGHGVHQHGDAQRIAELLLHVHFIPTVKVGTEYDASYAVADTAAYADAETENLFLTVFFCELCEDIPQFFHAQMAGGHPILFFDESVFDDGAVHAHYADAGAGSAHVHGQGISEMGINAQKGGFAAAGGILVTGLHNEAVLQKAGNGFGHRQQFEAADFHQITSGDADALTNVLQDPDLIPGICGKKRVKHIKDLRL